MPRAVVRGLGHLAGLGFGAFFQRGFARQLDSSFVIDAEAFHPNVVADFRDVFGRLTRKSASSQM